MDYKCKFNGKSGCANCKNSYVLDDGSYACAFSREYECECINCPVLSGYEYPRRIEWCEKCFFEPKS